jgi:hypothetical protein
LGIGLSGFTKSIGQSSVGSWLRVYRAARGFRLTRRTSILDALDA